MRLRPLFLIISVLMVTLLVVLTAGIVRNAWLDLRHAEQGLTYLRQMRALLVAGELASFERGPANAAMGSSIPNDPTFTPRLQAARVKTDEAFAALLSVLKEQDPYSASVTATVHKSLDQLARARKIVDARISQPQDQRSTALLRQAVHEMILSIEALIPAAASLTKDASTSMPSATDVLIAARQTALLRELAGQLGSRFIASLASKQPLTPEELTNIERLRGRIEQLRQQLAVGTSSMETRPQVRAATQVMLSEYFATSMPFIEVLTKVGTSTGRYNLTPAEFTARYVPTMSSILALRDTLLDDATSEAQSIIRHAQNVLVWTIAGSALLLVLMMLLGWLLHRRVVMALIKTTDLLVNIARGQHDVRVPAPEYQDEVGDMLGAIAVLRDNSVARKAAEDMIRQMAYYDRLTGLPNRRLLEDRMHQVLASAQRHHTKVAVMFIDLDKFKQVNDAHSHDAGDWLLNQVAQRMRTVLRESDTAARVGGDEFVVLLPDVAGAEDAVVVAEKIRQQLERPFIMSNGVVLDISSSIGVALYPDQADNPRDLLHCGDEAMYKVKKHGRNAVEVFGADDAAPLH